jgi:long-chain acyl-CoA synthetase
MPSRPWLAAYGRHIPAEINAEAYGSVLAMLEEAMKRYAGKPAFLCFGQTLSYADIVRDR